MNGSESQLASKRIDFSKQPGRWEAVLYIQWYVHRDLYFLAWGHKHPPFVFTRPPDLPRSSTKAIDELVRQGCDENLILAAAYVLATDPKKLKLQSVKEIQENIRRVSRSIRPLLILIAGRLGQEMDSKRSAFRGLPKLLQDFVEYAYGEIPFMLEVDGPYERAHYYHKQALRVLAGPIRDRLGRIPWKTIADLVTRFGRELSPENLKQQYHTIRRSEQKERERLHRST